MTTTPTCSICHAYCLTCHDAALNADAPTTLAEKAELCLEIASYLVPHVDDDQLESTASNLMYLPEFALADLGMRVSDRGLADTFEADRSFAEDSADLAELTQLAQQLDLGYGPLQAPQSPPALPPGDASTPPREADSAPPMGWEFL